MEKERDFSNVRRRTRKAMIEAVTQLVHEGASPSVTEVADAAGVSRATAYRYFPTQESLLAEVIVPDLEAALAAGDIDSPTLEDLHAMERELDRRRRM